MWNVFTIVLREVTRSTSTGSSERDIFDTFGQSVALDISQPCGVYVICSKMELLSGNRPFGIELVDRGGSYAAVR